MPVGELVNHTRPSKGQRRASSNPTTNPFDKAAGGNQADSPPDQHAMSRVASRRGSHMHDQDNSAAKEVRPETKRRKLKVGQRSVVMIVGVVQRPLQMGSVHMGIVESGGATYDIDVTLFSVDEWSQWRPVQKEEKRKRDALKVGWAFNHTPPQPTPADILLSRQQHPTT